MGQHPNVILLADLQPDGLSRKTMRDILTEFAVSEDDEIKIGENDYSHLVMEEDYDEGYQISAKKGNLVFFDFVTYGYGESISWEKLNTQMLELKIWADDVCKKFHCSYQIRVTANNW